MHALAANSVQTVLGIDPGAHGGLGLITLGAGWQYVASAVLPVRDRGKEVTNNVLDGKALGRILREWAPTLVVVEDVQPMPSRPEAGETEADRRSMPARSAYTLGGFCLGVMAACEALGFDTIMVRPSSWKRAAALPKVGQRRRSEVKADSLRLARELWPTAPLGLARDEAVAEALLIARFGLSTQVSFL